MSFLTVKHSISKAQDTYGYNRVTLIDQTTGKRYATCGGGYDMLGTCLGEYLQSNHQMVLATLVLQAYSVYNGCTLSDNGHTGNKLYGMTYNTITNGMTLDGACGFDCMVRIARAAGLTVNLYRDKKGHLTSMFIG